MEELILRHLFVSLVSRHIFLPFFTMKLSIAISTFFFVASRAVTGDRLLPVPSARIGSARQVSEPEAPEATPGKIHVRNGPLFDN